MSRTFTKIVLLSCAMLMCTPSTSHALGFRWLFGGGDCCNTCCSPGGGYTTARYRPLFPGLFGRRVSYYGGGCCSTGCNTCCSPCATTCCSPCTTCYQVKYVPQTRYRASVCNVPVTTYRRYTTCDPCTGCPVTCCRPCTTYARRVQYTPYTTYRAVCCPTTCCSPCCNSCCNGCNSCCNPCQTQVQSTTPINGGTINGGTINGGTTNGGTINGGTTNGPTYKEGSNTSYRGRATPQPPRPQDRSTKAAPRTWTFRHVSTGSSSAAPTKPAENDGWYSVKR